MLYYYSKQMRINRMIHFGKNFYSEETPEMGVLKWEKII